MNVEYSAGKHASKPFATAYIFTEPNQTVPHRHVNRTLFHFHHCWRWFASVPVVTTLGMGVFVFRILCVQMATTMVMAMTMKSISHRNTTSSHSSTTSHQHHYQQPRTHDCTHDCYRVHGMVPSHRHTVVSK